MTNDKPRAAHTPPYKEGFKDGLTCYAINKNGQQFVGSVGETLKEALENIESHWNYLPPQPETLPDIADLLRQRDDLLKALWTIRDKSPVYEKDDNHFNAYDIAHQAIKNCEVTNERS